MNSAPVSLTLTRRLAAELPEVLPAVDGATAIVHGMTVDQVGDLDLSCTEPLGFPWDAVQAGAEAWTRQATAR